MNKNKKYQLKKYGNLVKRHWHVQEKVVKRFKSC